MDAHSTPFFHCKILWKMLRRWWHVASFLFCTDWFTSALFMKSHWFLKPASLTNTINSNVHTFPFWVVGGQIMVSQVFVSPGGCRWRSGLSMNHKPLPPVGRWPTPCPFPLIGRWPIPCPSPLIGRWPTPCPFPLIGRWPTPCPFPLIGGWW